MRSIGKLAILSEGLSLQHSPISLIHSTVCDSTICLSGNEEALTARLLDSPQGTAHDVSHSTGDGQANPNQGSIDIPGDPTQGPAEASADKPDQCSDNAESEVVLPSQKLSGRHAEQAAPNAPDTAHPKQAGADRSASSLPLDAAPVSETATASAASEPTAASAEEAAAASSSAVATASAASEPAAAAAEEAAAAAPALKAAGGPRAAREAAQRVAELLLLEAIQVATAMVDAYPHVHDELVAVLASGLKQALGKLSMAMSACMSADVTAGPCCMGTKPIHDVAPASPICYHPVTGLM